MINNDGNDGRWVDIDLGVNCVERGLRKSGRIMTRVKRHMPHACHFCEKGGHDQNVYYLDHP
jgi:hypothetical protein